MDPCEEYHKWYYDNEVWEETHFLGVPCLKSVSDMWNYQEILAERKPVCVVEFGTRFGGASLFFSILGRMVSPGLQVLTVDITHADTVPEVLENPDIQVMTCSSTDPAVSQRIAALRAQRPGPVFFILDSDHSKSHVLAELEMLREITTPGDYVVVEDGNINGNPVLPGWGEGPSEALVDYFDTYPDDYLVDRQRESKFGFTFAPSGYLIRR